MEIQQLINALQEADRQFVAQYDHDHAMDHSLASLIFVEKLIAEGRAGKHPTMRGVRHFWASDFQVGAMAYLGETLNAHFGLQWAFSGNISHPLLVCDIEENLMPIEIWPLVGRFLRLARDPIGPLSEEIISLVAGQVRNGFMQVGRSFWDSDRVVVYRKDLISRLEHFLPECTIQPSNHQTILIITPDKRGVQIVLDSNLHEYLDGKLEAEPAAHAQQILALMLKENIVTPTSVRGLETNSGWAGATVQQAMDDEILTDVETVVDTRFPVPPQTDESGSLPAMMEQVLAEMEEAELEAPPKDAPAKPVAAETPKPAPVKPAAASEAADKDKSAPAKPKKKPGKSGKRKAVE